ncbi:MAG: hypothetical protein QW555_07860 [Nitrososphaerota archaeon]
MRVEKIRDKIVSADADKIRELLGAHGVVINLHTYDMEVYYDAEKEREDDVKTKINNVKKIIEKPSEVTL